MQPAWLAYQPWTETLERLGSLLLEAQQGALAVALVTALTLVGWGLAALLSRLALLLLRAIRFNEAVRSSLGRDGAEWGHEPAALASWAAFWVVLLLAVGFALDTLGWNIRGAVGARLGEVLPRVVTSIILLLFGLLLARLLGVLSRRFLEGAGLRGARLGGQAVTAIFTFFAAMLALEQLGLAAQFVLALGIAVFAAVALAAGLAFGLGCRDLARDFIVEYLRSLDEEGPKRNP